MLEGKKNRKIMTSYCFSTHIENRWKQTEERAEQVWKSFAYIGDKFVGMPMGAICGEVSSELVTCSSGSRGGHPGVRPPPKGPKIQKNTYEFMKIWMVVL